jgi:seryl-tRNA(Sec) selenium transferase
MKILLAAVILVLTSSAAIAEAPCENPRTLPCQKACALMGAKFVLATREETLRIEQLSRETAAPARVVLSSGSANTWQMLENAQRLAGLAGVSLQEVDRMRLRDLGAAVEQYCRPTPR